MKWYSILEAAQITGSSKSTVRRYLAQLQDAGELPAEGISHAQRAGHTVILLSQGTVDALKAAITNQTTDQTTVDGASQNAHHDAPDAPWSDPRTEELIAELKDRVSALTVELAAKNEQLDRLSIALDRAQEATAAAQALHAATAEQLRLLTAARDAQGEQEPPTGTDTTPAEDDAQEPQEAHVEAGTANAEIPVATGTDTTARASLRDRLRFLFRGW